jgi:hypothetical protein
MAVSPAMVFGQTLFSDDFDADHTAGWVVRKSTGVNANDAGSSAEFFFDYSALGLPSAPHSRGGTARGLRLRANMSGNIFSGLSVSPLGQGFSGDYRVEFDLWMNYNGRLDGGGNGTTQLAGAGLGTQGTNAQWAGGTQDSVWFAATLDGGSAQDYRAYSSAAPTGYGGGSGVYPAGTGSGAQNNTNAYYSGFTPRSAPATQLALFPQQTNSTPAGTLAFGWRGGVIAKAGNLVTWSVDGLPIATVNTSSLALSTNILFNYFDSNASSSTDSNATSLLFAVIDNVRVQGALVFDCATNKAVNCGDNWDFDPPSVSDDPCTNNVTITIVSTVTNGSCPPLVTRTWRVTDLCGNTNTCSQMVTVLDATPPIIICASDKTVAANISWEFDPPSAYDSCCGSNVSVQLISTNATVLSACQTLWAGVWQASDCCSNTSTCTQLVTVVPPIIPATNIWVSATSGNWGASNNWSQGRPPRAGDTLLITNANTKNVTVDASTSACALTVSNITIGWPGGFGSNTLALVHGTTNPPLHVLHNLTLTSGGELAITNALLQVDGLINVGAAGAASFWMVSGGAQSGGLALGSGTNSSGHLSLKGGTLAIQGNLTLGAGPSNSAGLLDLTGGALSTTGVLGIGNDGSPTNGSGSGSANFANVSVSAASVLLGSTAGGVGSLTLGSNAVVAISSNLTVLSGSLTATSTVTLAGGSLLATNGTVRVGEVGSGEVAITGGNHTIWQLSLGGTNGSGTGSLVLSNGHLKVLYRIIGNSILVGCGDLDGSGGTIILGEDHDATMKVVCGKATNINSLLVGYTPQYSGSFTKSGGLTLVTNALVVGDTDDCVNGPVGNLTVANGYLGVTNTSHDAVLSVRNGSVTMSGGTVVADVLDLSHPCGQFNLAGGTLHYGQLLVPAGTPPLKLTITLDETATAATLSWPSIYVGYALQQCTELPQPDALGNWTPVGQPSTVQGATRSVTITPLTGSTFYRLAKP